MDEATAPEQPKPLTKADAVKLWHDADTVEKKRAAVKAFPKLAEIYSEAQNYV
jgi:hypothetical protein